MLFVSNSDEKSVLGAHAEVGIATQAKTDTAAVPKWNGAAVSILPLRLAHRSSSSSSSSTSSRRKSFADEISMSLLMNSRMQMKFNYTGLLETAVVAEVAVVAAG
jgi:hypothetical protein